MLVIKFTMAQQVKETVRRAVSSSESSKIDQLSHVMVEPSKDTRISTDFGVKQSNTDDWLRVNRPDQIGPMLLEDNASREKVNCLHLRIQVLDKDTTFY
jgi:catalase